MYLGQGHTKGQTKMHFESKIDKFIKEVLPNLSVSLMTAKLFKGFLDYGPLNDPYVS